MKNRNLEHSDDWATPEGFYQRLNDEFDFDFDPCPLHKPFDGLNVKWGDRNYINPPYSKELKEAFIKRAVKESKRGKLCVMLLPVSTSTKIFHEVILPNADEIRFVKGRLSFVYHGGGDPDLIVSDGKQLTLALKVPKKNAKGMHDSMIVIFRRSLMKSLKIRSI